MASATQPVVVVCIDLSGSMGEGSAKAVQGALRDALALPAGQKLGLRLGITTFGSRTQVLLAPTDVPEQVEAALRQLRLDRDRAGKTRLNDAVAAGLAQLAALRSPSSRLIVISDGEDEGSAVASDELLRRALASGIPIDAIGFGARAQGQSGALATLAGASGGRFLAATQADNLHSALANFLQAQPPRSAPAAGPTASAEARASAPPAAASSAEAAPEPPPDTVYGRLARWLSSLGSGRPAVWAMAGLVFVLLLALVTSIALWRRRRRAGAAPAAAAESGGGAPVTSVGAQQGWHPDEAAAVATGQRARPTESAGSAAPLAILRVLAGEQPGRTIEMRGRQLRMGADADNDLVLGSDAFVSAHHARLRVESGQLFLDDLGATNGTVLNRIRFKLGSRALSAGDHITLGRTTLELLGAYHGR